MSQTFQPLVCFLTDNELNNKLCDRYWSISDSGEWSETFDTLLAESGLTRSELLNVVSSACRAFHPSFVCKQCRARLIIPRRTGYSPATGYMRGFHREIERNLCTGCEDARRGLDQVTPLPMPCQAHSRADETAKRPDLDGKQIDYARLSYVQCVLLYATLLAADQGDVSFAPLDFQEGLLAPTPELAEEIHARLRCDGILLPVQASDRDAFQRCRKSGLRPANVRTTAWKLADDAFGRSLDEILSVLSRRIDRLEPTAVRELWDLVAESECLRYFARQYKRYRLGLRHVDLAKVGFAMRAYLDRLSIGNAKSVISSMLAALERFARKRNLPENQIAELIGVKLRLAADEYLSQGGLRTAHVRARQDKDSFITRVLLDKVLKDGDFSYKELTGLEVAAYAERLVSNGAKQLALLDVDPEHGLPSGSSSAAPANRSKALTGILRLGNETVESAIDLGDGYMVIKLHVAAETSTLRAVQRLAGANPIPHAKVHRLLHNLKQEANASTGIVAISGRQTDIDAHAARMREETASWHDELRKSGHLIGHAELCRSMQITPEVLFHAIEEKNLFALEGSDGSWLYPAFFASSAISRRELVHVIRVLSPLPDNAKWQFFTTSDTALGARTPIEALSTGRYADVARVARKFVDRLRGPAGSY